jgi:hypothetical protein
MVQQEVRQYELRARSTETFGRVLCSARTHHFVVDGPLQNGCPGEAITPGELFLSGVATCGVELVQVLARAQQVPLQCGSVALSPQGSHAGARHPAHRGLQAQVTALRHGRSCDPGCPGRA